MTCIDRVTRGIVLSAALLAVLAGAATARADEAFDTVMEHYGSIHRALVADDLGAAREPAARLTAAITDLRQRLDVGTAGVTAEHRDKVKALLPELDEAAVALRAAGDLGAARDAFYALTKPLVRWRQTLGAGPAVVYCPMKKRSWLQSADQEIGNPYYGQKMATCGEIVSS